MQLRKLWLNLEAARAVVVPTLANWLKTASPIVMRILRGSFENEACDVTVDWRVGRKRRMMKTLLSSGPGQLYKDYFERLRISYSYRDIV